MASGQIPGHFSMPPCPPESQPPVSSPAPGLHACQWCPKPPDTALRGPLHPHANARRVCRSFLSSDFLPALHLPRPSLRPPPAKNLPRFAGLREMLRAMQSKCPCSAFLSHGTGGLAEGGGLFGFHCHASD